MKHPSDLPNIAGFRFIGISYDNKSGICEVYKKKDTGLHAVRGVFGYSDLVGWEEIKIAPEKKSEILVEAKVNP
jgi:hypothetical protein